VLAEIRFLILPYAGEQRGTLLDLLIAELRSGNWSRFSAAVAFAKQSGNYVELLEAMAAFAEAGNTIELTFGANTFGAEAAGSDYEAISTLLNRLRKYQNATCHLYREKSRTFHPKIYLLDNEKSGRALVVIGSSNWSAGGFHDNVEASVVVELDLAQPGHREGYVQLRDYFTNYWQELGSTS
jgi:phosphatidylserine/phosphatidylglycerophosphate/cardiolipin synthase-like enzyme